MKALLLAEQHYKTDAAEQYARAAWAVAAKQVLELDVLTATVRKAGLLS
jgi:hypothetical protein